MGRRRRSLISKKTGRSSTARAAGAREPGSGDEEVDASLFTEEPTDGAVPRPGPLAEADEPTDEPTEVVPRPELEFTAEDVSTVREPVPPPMPEPEDGIGLGMLGGFDEGGPPPTDEVPSAILQDVSQPYTAPMNVPEPPPIPGILDRFTPVSAAPRAIAETTAQKKNRPAYIADTPTPPPMLKRRDVPSPGHGGNFDYGNDDDDGRGGTPILPLLMGGMALLGLTGLVLAGVFGWMAWNKGDPAGSVVKTPTPTQPAPVGPKDEEYEGRAGVKVKVKEGLRNGGNTPSPEPLVAPEPAVDPEPVPSPEPSVPDPSAPPPAPAEPRPTVPDPTPTEAAAEATGTLKIRSNRKVLLYVDGKAIGYTPTTYKTESGAHTVTAMLPGRPESKKQQNVSVTEGGVMPVNFTF